MYSRIPGRPYRNCDLDGAHTPAKPINVHSLTAPKPASGDQVDGTDENGVLHIQPEHEAS